jgi:hypothetical protein
MPDATQAENRFPLNLSWSPVSPSDLMLKNTKASLNFVIVYLVLQNINTPKEACHGKE